MHQSIFGLTSSTVSWSFFLQHQQILLLGQCNGLAVKGLCGADNGLLGLFLLQAVGKLN